MKLTRKEVELAANPPKHGKYHDPSRQDLASELLEAWELLEGVVEQALHIECIASSQYCDCSACRARKYLEGR